MKITHLAHLTQKKKSDILLYMEKIKFKGDFIRSKRRELGLNQKRLAALAGVTFQAISQYENSKETTEITVLPKLANALGVKVSDIADLPDFLTN